MIILNIPLILSCNSDIITSYCYAIYIAFITILIVNSIDFVTLLSIYPSKRSLYFFVISEMYLYIAISITLSIVFNRIIDLYILGICFVFYDLLGLARIITSTLYRHFRKYLYIKLMFVILTMIIVRDLLYIFRNPINKQSFSRAFYVSI